jgi:hypothetical protein
MSTIATTEGEDITLDDDGAVAISPSRHRRRRIRPAAASRQTRRYLVAP